MIKNTTLVSIVRDERMNCAGGIGLWVHSHLPYVEKSIVIDTGSIDGTREELESLKTSYPNLEVLDHKWVDYADARNRYLREAKTQRVLVLDADELLTPEDFLHLAPIIDKHPKGAVFGFEFIQIFPDGTYYLTRGEEIMSWKIFDAEGANYSTNKWHSEDLEIRGKSEFIQIPITVKHFLSGERERRLKRINWYSKRGEQQANQNDWKKFNPIRLKYPWPDKLEKIKYFLERGVFLEE